MLKVTVKVGWTAVRKLNHLLQSGHTAVCACMGLVTLCCVKKDFKAPCVALAILSVAGSARAFAATLGVGM